MATLLDPLQQAEPADVTPVVGPAITLSARGRGTDGAHLVFAVRSAARASAVWHDVFGRPVARIPSAVRYERSLS